MFGKACWISIFFLIGIHSALPSDDPIAGVLNGPATLGQIFAGNGQLYDAKCSKTECAAMDDIAKSFETLLHRDVPNGLARLHPKLFNPEDYNRKVKHLLAVHPERRAIYCRILRRIAHHYDEHSQEAVGGWAIQIAALISPACTRSVIAAFSDTKPVHKMFRSAREDCASWREPGCGLIMRARRGDHP